MHKIFEVNGYVWDYEKIATAAARIGDEFLERMGIPVAERHRSLASFAYDVLDMQNNASETAVLPPISKKHRNALFQMRISGENIDCTYDAYNQLWDFYGRLIPEDYEFDNSVSLSFLQKAHRDPLIKDTDVPRWNAEEVMDFVKEIPNKYPGLNIRWGLSDFPQAFLSETRYGIISKLDFDRETYGIGTGRIKVGILHEAIRPY